MSKPYIALVDDDRHVVKLLKQTLEESGYEVSATTSGKTLLHIIKGRKPDLVILDLNMPEPDGFALLKTVRAEHPYLRTIAISGYLKGASLEAARYAGATATLEKPFDPEALVNEVRQILGGSFKAARSTKAAPKPKK